MEEIAIGLVAGSPFLHVFRLGGDIISPVRRRAAIRILGPTNPGHSNQPLGYLQYALNYASNATMRHRLNSILTTSALSPTPIAPDVGGSEDAL